MLDDDTLRKHAKKLRHLRPVTRDAEGMCAFDLGPTMFKSVSDWRKTLGPHEIVGRLPVFNHGTLTSIIYLYARSV